MGLENLKFNLIHFDSFTWFHSKVLYYILIINDQNYKITNDKIMNLSSIYPIKSPYYVNQ